MNSIVSNFPMEGSQNLLSFAALFDGSFSIDWLVELTGVVPSQVLGAIEEGMQHGLILQKNPGEFFFINEEERLKWRDQLPSREKDLFQNRISDYLLKKFPDTSGKRGGQNYDEANAAFRDDGQRYRWLMRIGRKHSGSFVYEEAAKVFSRVLDGLSGLHGRDNDSLFIDAAVEYSTVSLGKYDPPQIFPILEKAILRAKKWGMFSSAAILQMHLGLNEFLRSDYTQAMKHFEEGHSILEKVDDSNLRKATSLFTVFHLYSQGRFHEAIRAYEKEVAADEERTKNKIHLFISIIVARCYTYIGQVTQGLGMIDVIREFCISKGDHYSAAHAGYYIGTTMLDIRRISDAIQTLEWSLDESQKGSNRWVWARSQVVLANAYYLRGENSRSIELLRAFINYIRENKITARPYPYLMELCWAMEQKKLPPIAGLSLTKEVDRMINDHNVYIKGAAYRHKALLQRQNGLPAEDIIQTLNLSMEWLERSGSQVEIAKSQLELAQQSSLVGDERRAEEIRQRAFSILSFFNKELLPDELKLFMGDQTQEQSFNQNLLKVILKLGQEVVSLKDSRNLVGQIISTVNRITGAERGAIFIGGENSNPPIHLLASKNLSKEEVAHASFLSSMKMIEEVFLTRKGRILEMSLAYDRSPSSLPTGHISSRICVPMILRDKCVGVLYHDNRILKGIFKESDLEVLAYFASHAALALENVRFYDEMKKANQRLREEKLYYAEQHLRSLHFDDIVGQSSAILHVINQVDQVAKMDTAVLLLGETGVGKDLIAKAIHRRSHRKDKPFIMVFCNTIPDSLIPSELFGHEKGAFTGATQRRIGKFELANGGTIFVDEIGELPLDIQVLLLQVLQNKSFERVGGDKAIHSNFRLVTATNRNLEQQVRDLKFRSDLYYRLNVFPIYIPSLRERKEDIPLLANHFLKIFDKKFQKGIKEIPDFEMEKMIRYDWPGNVRELINVIERGAIVYTGGEFRLPEMGIDGLENNPWKASDSLRENERRHILWALQKTGWKVRGKGGAAELLNIHFSTLGFRMKKLGIQRPPEFSGRGRKTLGPKMVNSPAKLH